MGLHECRHSAVSMWIGAGLNVQLVSELAARQRDHHARPVRQAVPVGLDDARTRIDAYLELADTAARLAQAG
jgi:hypothetical protein